MPTARAIACAVLLSLLAAGRAVAETGVFGLLPERARYAPGDTVKFRVALPPGVAGAAVNLHITTSSVTAGQRRVPAGAGRELLIDWTAPSTDFTGYHVHAVLIGPDDRPLATASTALDVSSDWRRFPRYGFVSTYDESVRPDAVVESLRAMHVTAVQFYDWMPSHHVPAPAGARWLDIAKRPVLGRVITALTGRARDAGMRSFAYNLAYGAYENFETDGSGVERAWGVFKLPEASVESHDFHPLPDGWATPRLMQFNPASVGWRAHINGQMKRAIADLGFDGWHVDTLGGRGELFDSAGRPVVLHEHFGPFVAEARRVIGAPLIFNAVGLYGMPEIIAAGDATDVLYAELWDDPATDDYADLVRITDDLRAKSGGKAVVFAAYLNRGLGRRVPAGERRPFNAPGVLLAESVILAAGATHLAWGDDGHMLSNEYFPNRNLYVPRRLRDDLRDWATFAVAHQHLLRGGDVTPAPVSVEVAGHAASADGTPGGLLAITRRAGPRTIVHLINLTAATSPRWRDDLGRTPAVPTLKDLWITLRLPRGAAARHAWVAAPDRAAGRPEALSIAAGPNAEATAVTLVLPSLGYWAMLCVE